jgi:hypothetical protein
MAEHVLRFRDVRLKGWQFGGDSYDVNFDTPTSWLINLIKSRASTHGGNLVVVFSCHGLPGFLLCAQGRKAHPTAGNGLSEDDLPDFAQVRGLVKRFEFRACLVARIGTCFETKGHSGWDGNRFCFRFAQVTGAEVKASLHLQYGLDGTDVNGNHIGPSCDLGWAGRVYTWAKEGNIIKMEDFAYIPASVCVI